MAARRTQFVQIGQRFGHLTVVDPEVRVETSRQRPRGARLVCDCGTFTVATLNSLICGSVVSCGCFRREHNAEVMRRAAQARSAALHREAGRRIAAGRKTCARCGETKDLETGFRRRAGALDGREPACRACVDAARRELAFRAAAEEIADQSARAARNRLAKAAQDRARRTGEPWPDEEKRAEIAAQAAEFRAEAMRLLEAARYRPSRSAVPDDACPMCGGDGSGGHDGGCLFRPRTRSADPVNRRLIVHC